MLLRRWLWGLALFGGSGAEQVLAEDPVSFPTAAELVRQVRAESAELGSQEAVYLRFAGVWTRPPAAIARSLAALERQYPDDLELLTPERWPQLRPRSEEELEYAWDRRRAFRRICTQGSHLYVQTFDTERVIWYENYFTHRQENFTILKWPYDPLAQDFFADLSWLRMGPQAVLWNRWSALDEAGYSDWQAKADDFYLVGRERYRGRDCYRIETSISDRYWIDVADRRFRGMQTLLFWEQCEPFVAANLPQIQQVAGAQVTDAKTLRRWWVPLARQTRSIELSPQERELFYRLSTVQFDFYVDDYREVAPAMWVPTEQGYFTGGEARLTEPDELAGRTHRHLTLAEARMNEPLADELFEPRWIDGVRVVDLTYEPPLVYEYQADRTPAEWEAILAEHAEQVAIEQRQQQRVSALMGQSAPRLPAMRWFNTEPVAGDALQGKFVLLNFWAYNCGPCHNELGLLEALSRREAERLVVVGVHAEDDDDEAIRNDIAKYKLTYPIVVDVPREQDGSIFSQLAIDRMPWAVLVDPQGTVIAHGDTSDVVDVLDDRLRDARPTGGEEGTAK